MPLYFIQDKDAAIQADAVIHLESTKTKIGTGMDWQLFRKAGPALLAARNKHKSLQTGAPVVTPGFGLPVKSVVHVVCPLWKNGGPEEAEALKTLLLRIFDVTAKKKWESIVFPLNCVGLAGFPATAARRVILDVLRPVLQEKELTVYLVEASRDTLPACGEHLQNLSLRLEAEVLPCPAAVPSFAKQTPVKPAFGAASLEAMLRATDKSFSERLIQLIDNSGRKDSEIYKRANVDRRLFSKIRKNADYKPSKTTAVAFAVALELDLEETMDLIGRAGYTLTHSSKFDIIIEYFISQKEYDIFVINETLFYFDQMLLGA